MEIEILKTVSLGGRILFKGEVHKVTTDIAAKWLGAGYAKEAAQPKPTKTKEKP